jgi:hypothetical protein
MKAIFEKLSFTSCGISFNGIALTRYIKSPFKTKEEGYADTEKRILEDPESAREYLKKSVIEENHQYIHIYTCWAFVFTAIAIILFTISILSYKHGYFATCLMLISLTSYVMRVVFLRKAAMLFNWIPNGLFQMDIYIISILEKHNKKSQL